MFPVPTKKNVKKVQVGNQQSGNTNTFLIENYSFPHTGDKTSVVIKATLQLFFPPAMFLIKFCYDRKNCLRDGVGGRH